MKGADVEEVKRCGMCKHWEQASGFPHYDGGFPGRCLATTPLWVDLRFGPFTIDRQNGSVMYTTQYAMP